MQDGCNTLENRTSFIECVDDGSLLTEMQPLWQEAKVLLLQSVAVDLHAACVDASITLNSEHGTLEMLNVLRRVCGDDDREALQALQLHTSLSEIVAVERPQFEEWVAEMSTITNIGEARAEGKKWVEASHKEQIALAAALKKCAEVSTDMPELLGVQREAERLIKRVADMAKVNVRTRLEGVRKALTDEACAVAWKSGLADTASLDRVKKAAEHLLDGAAGEELVRTFKVNMEEPSG